MKALGDFLLRNLLASLQLGFWLMMRSHELLTPQLYAAHRSSSAQKLFGAIAAT